MKTLKIMFLSFIIFLACLFLITFIVLKLPQFGTSSKGKRWERIQNSPQFNKEKGIFENQSETPMMSKDASYFKMLKLFLFKEVETEPAKALPALKDPFDINPVRPVITWFGHSSYLIQISRYNILVDPVFSERASPFSFLGSKAYPVTQKFEIEELPVPEVVILSHDHYDHLDYESILKLKSKVKKFVVPLGVGAHLESWGIDTSAIIEMDWWEKVLLDENTELVCTPARHFSGRGLLDRTKTLWASYALTSGDTKIFLGGDSGYDTHFKEIGDKYGPFNLALLECGQYNAFWPYIHMMPEEVAIAAKDLKAEILMPVHWAKFSLALHSWEEPIERVVRAAEKEKVTISTPMIGQHLEVGMVENKQWWKLTP